jgi:hypothetical protein
MKDKDWYPGWCHIWDTPNIIEEELEDEEEIEEEIEETIVEE